MPSSKSSKSNRSKSNPKQTLKTVSSQGGGSGGQGNNNNTNPSSPSASSPFKHQQSPPPSSSSSDPTTDPNFLNALEDVHTRFILNLPASETASSERIFFQIEQAWWFYEDFLCDDMDEETTTPAKNQSSTLPRFNNVKPFAKKIFEISPLLSPLIDQFDSMWKDFSQYRRKISTYGTILINERCTKVVLCQDWSGKAWTFPAGKVNQNEKGVDAGARETYEETGFDPNCKFGITKDMKQTALLEQNNNDQNSDQSGSSNNNSNSLLPWNELQDEDALGYVEDGSGKRRTCFVCHGVPETFPFAPVARKEVSKIEWHDLNNLPKKTYAVHPFMTQLKRWIKNYKRNKRKNNNNTTNITNNNSHKKNSKKQTVRSTSNTNNRSMSRGSIRSSNTSRSRSVITENDDLYQSGLANIGDDGGWDEAQMFRRNEELVGRKITYDGNPQLFATKGFDGIDPHAFRVVGGQLMNSDKAVLVGGGVGGSPSSVSLSGGERRNRPGVGSGVGLVEEQEKEDEEKEELPNGELKPFFSEGGVSPWGDVMAEALAKDAAKTNKKTSTKVNVKTEPMNTKRKGSIGSAVSDSSSIASFPPPEETSFVSAATNQSGLSILSMLRRGENVTVEAQGVENKGSGRTIPAAALPSVQSPSDRNNTGIFLTDKKITARSISDKSKKAGGAVVVRSSTTNKKKDGGRSEGSKSTDKRKVGKTRGKMSDRKQDPPLKYLCEWANSLPKTEPSKHFGDFRFDVDSIMEAVKSR